MGWRTASVGVTVKRSKRLPFGRRMYTSTFGPISRAIVGALEFATGEQLMGWANHARPLSVGSAY